MRIVEESSPKGYYISLEPVLGKGREVALLERAFSRRFLPNHSTTGREVKLLCVFDTDPPQLGIKLLKACWKKPGRT